MTTAHNAGWPKGSPDAQQKGSQRRSLLLVLPRPVARPLLGVAVALALGLVAPALQASTAQTAVGEVSLVLGKAWLHSADGSKEAVRIGTRIGVSDSIETDSNGHVHVRFIDQALVSVRPSSTLEILRYDYNAQNPAASAIKLNLVEGVARSISGKAAQGARQNFRMNTPIAAIGVRGTDFVVRASQDNVRALVNEGTIVVAPFSNDCSVDALGPCSINALELAGGVSQLVEVSASSLQPVLLPLPGTQVREALELQQPELLLAAGGKTEHEEDGGADIYTDSVASRAVNLKLSNGLALAPAAPPEYTPDAVLTTAQLTSNTQLVWGRWTENRTSSLERITVPYDVAVANGRQVTVGNDFHALFRVEQGSKNLNPGLGVLGFNLSQAQATLNVAGARDLMDVYGGQLNVDIENRRFSTSLDLGHAATGKFQYQDSGLVFDSGVFNSRHGLQATAGVLSIDGKEAGYFFETTVPAGQIEGLTLWSVQP